MGIRQIVILGLLLCLWGCKEVTIPKPKAMLRLEYPAAAEKYLETPYFSFEYNSLAQVKTRNDASLTLDYPGMKGSVFITYKPVKGNLVKLLTDAQRLSLEHVSKADAIEPTEFVNDAEKVYGMFYEVRGDAASQAQFYATDSIRHFVTGSLYFYARPNYDSLYPAAIYLQKDIRRIMETLRWK